MPHRGEWQKGQGRIFRVFRWEAAMIQVGLCVSSYNSRLWDFSIARSIATTVILVIGASALEGGYLADEFWFIEIDESSGFSGFAIYVEDVWCRYFNGVAID